jgi:hypothetical protein
LIRELRERCISDRWSTAFELPESFDPADDIAEAFAL